jgi:hypothetical protein
MGDLAEVDRGPVAVDEQDDGEADADLGRGHRDHEQGEHLADDRLGEAPPGSQGDEVDVHRVEDQLDGHEHQHRVAAGDDAVQADAEQDGG